MAVTSLSFDDGPGPSTVALLDVLCAARCTVSFFLLGKNLEQDMSAATRMIREGHTLGNHAYSHARPTELTDEALINEIEATDTLIRQAYRSAGCAMPAVIPLRLPYGVQPNDRRLPVLENLAREHTGWTAIFEDWREPAPSAQTLCHQMAVHLDDCFSKGRDALLCLHDSSHHRDSRPATVEAVRLLLESPRYWALLASDKFRP